MAINNIEFENYLNLAKQLRCPSDQIQNFLRGAYIAQPMQLRFHAAARAADLPGGPDEIGVGGARGPGKSHCIFSQMALDDCQRFEGLKCLYLRKIGKQAREQLEDLKSRILKGVPHVYNRHEGVVKLFKDSRIVMGHFQHESDIDAHLGLEYDVIGIEECTTLSKSKYQALRDSNRTSKSGWRPRIYNSTNPLGIGHIWYKKHFVLPWRQKAERFTKFIPGTIDDNKFIDDDYRRKLEGNTGSKLKAYRYGDWDVEAGLFFDEFRHDLHVLKRDYPLEPWWRRGFAFDPGFNHPFAFGAYAIDGDGNVIKYLELTEPKKHLHEIAEMILKYCPEAKGQPIYSGHDAWSRMKDGGPCLADQFAGYGIYLVKANIDRKQGANEMRRLLHWQENEQGQLIIPPRLFFKENCSRTIQQLPEMIMDEKNPEDVLKVDATEDDPWCGDDLYDETRYFIRSWLDASPLPKNHDLKDLSPEARRFAEQHRADLEGSNNSQNPFPGLSW